MEYTNHADETSGTKCALQHSKIAPHVKNGAVLFQITAHYKASEGGCMVPIKATRLEGNLQGRITRQNLVQACNTRNLNGQQTLHLQHPVNQPSQKVLPLHRSPGKQNSGDKGHSIATHSRVSRGIVPISVSPAMGLPNGR